MEGVQECSSDLGVCGSCQLPFPRQYSKVERILVPGRQEEEEEILSICEALSVIFELPPLTLLSSSRQELSQAKSVFKDGGNPPLAICVNCSETLKILYIGLVNFSKACRLESDIGKLLQKLRRKDEEAQTQRVRILVKMEPPDDNEEEEQDQIDDMFEAHEHIIVKVPPENEEEEQSSSQPDGVQTRQMKRLTINHMKDNSENPNTTTSNPPRPSSPQEIPVNISYGRGYIKQLKCPLCPKQFVLESTLLCHRRIIHGERLSIQRPVSILPRVHLTSQLLSEKRKALADANEKTSTCPLCREVVPRTEIRYHLASHTRRPSALSLHQNKKTHLNGIPCKRCGKEVPPLEVLLHIRECFAGKPHEEPCRAPSHFWSCKLCGINFTEQSAMETHMRSHKQKKSHRCKICDKCFDRGDMLRLHVKRFHKNNDKPPSSVDTSAAWDMDVDDDDGHFGDDDPLEMSSPVPPESTAEASTAEARGYVDMTPILENYFPCAGCEMTFAKAIDLNNHLLSAHAQSDKSQSSFLCVLCNRQLQDDYCLKLHMKTHGEMKPISCFYPDCDNVSSQKNDFFYHLLENHKLETKAIIAKYPTLFPAAPVGRKRKKPEEATNDSKGEFPCEICGRVFPKLSGVKQHIKFSHGSRDFLCKHCGKSFVNRHYFLTHEKLHLSNEANYKCHLCGKGFRLPGNLREHLKSSIHNSAREFVCEHCGKGFNRKDNLNLHVKKVHLKLPANQSARQIHRGGRHRIYVGPETESASAAKPTTVTATKSEPIPGTSHSNANITTNII